MKITIEPPPAMEMLNIAVSEKTLVVEPMQLKGQFMTRICYLTATGKGGAESKGVVMFNSRTGIFSLQQLGDRVPVTSDFDKPAAEFEAARKARVAAGAKSQKKRIAALNKPAENTGVTLER
jgi:hypothetical protein